MKIVASNGKKTLKISKTEWVNIGKKAGWMKKAFGPQDSKFPKMEFDNPQRPKVLPDELDELESFAQNIERYWPDIMDDPDITMALINIMRKVRSKKYESKPEEQGQKEIAPPYQAKSKTTIEKKSQIIYDEKSSISIPVYTLQDWALCLSQGDNRPRWEIEKILKDNGHSTRSGL